MKILMVTALAALLAGPAFAQGANTGPASGAKISPHTYIVGEKISPSYGKFSEVSDWQIHHLSKPDEGSHWVLYGHNYLLVKTNDGSITKIKQVS